MSDGAVEITAQNHGFAVRRGSTPDAVDGAPALRVTHVNLNDQTMEGLEHRELPVFSVQYHPEAAPGPTTRGICSTGSSAAMAARRRKSLTLRCGYYLS
jgi:carbamoyl-phosphate synthase small subunit